MTIYIDGTWTESHSSQRIDVINPATEEVFDSVPDGDDVDIDRAVQSATSGFAVWSALSGHERATVIRTFADELAARADAMGHAITSTNGTPISESTGAAPHAAGQLRYFAELAEQLDMPDVRPFPGAGPHGSTLVRHVPVGVAGLITPWNFPLTLIMGKLAPALAAGCSVVIKPAAETSLDPRVLVEAAEAAGIPAGVINVVTGGRETGAALVAHDGVNKIGFTGSTGAGKAIGAVCGEKLRPVTLELGGKSAAIVLDDANIEDIRAVLVRTCMRNTGQTCYATTRMLVAQSRYAEVQELVAEIIGSAKQGNPLETDTVFGPVVSRSQYDKVLHYIEIGKTEGARVITGGGAATEFDRGYYIKPTVFADVPPTSRIAREEIFGPVLSMMSFATDADALALANDSQYGLGGTVFSADTDRAERIAMQMETGNVGINFYASNHAAPFGGWKQSGLGVEFGPEGLSAYLKPQSIHRKYS